MHWICPSDYELEYCRVIAVTGEVQYKFPICEVGRKPWISN